VIRALTAPKIACTRRDGESENLLGPLKHEHGVRDAADREGGQRRDRGRNHDGEFAVWDLHALTVAPDAPGGEDARGEDQP
jgi:hypothetical protein